MMEKLVSVDRARKRHVGLSLIEAVAFLAIAALVIGAALMMYNSAQVEQQTTQTVKEFESFKIGVKSLHGNGSQPYITNAVSMHNILINARRYPTTLMVSGNSFTNAFGGTVDVVGNDVGSARHFYVSYNNVPRAVCVGLLTGLSRIGDWTHYHVTTTTGSISTDPSSIPTGGITAETASNSSNCAQADRVRVTFWSR